MTAPGAPGIRSRFSRGAWDLAFSRVRVEILNSRHGRARVELWVDASLDDGDDEDEVSDAVPSNVISFEQARQDLARRLVLLIDERHRVLRRYPVLPSLAKSSGWEPETLGPAYLHHLRRDLEAANAPRTGANRLAGSPVTLTLVRGHSEGPQGATR